MSLMLYLAVAEFGTGCENVIKNISQEKRQIIWIKLLVEVRVRITELLYVGSAKIKTKCHKQ